MSYRQSVESACPPQYADHPVEEQRTTPTSRGLRPEQAALSREWKRQSRAATIVAVFTSPAFFLVLVANNDWPVVWALIVTFFAVIAFRGLIDILAHKLIPRPSLYGADREQLLDDAAERRRLWYWRGKFRFVAWIAGILFALLLVMSIMLGESINQTLDSISNAIPTVAPQLLILGLQLPLLFLINFGILFGPLLVFGLKQMKGYEPGDADWGVKLEDVRGQTEPKQDVTRVIELWQSGEEFRKAGGKPERGLLFIGAPGTGKTILSKAIATSFNSPIVTMPGSGFAQTFIGMDVVILMFLIRKARKLARKWGGTCMVFIDEIDAVGMRRQALGNGRFQPLGNSFEQPLYGQWGALTPTGDLIKEDRRWREH